VLPNIDVFLVLTVAHESGKQVPEDVLEAAADEFAARLELVPQARDRLRKLPPAGQGYCMHNFKPEDDAFETSKALIRYVHDLRRQHPPPWGKGAACSLRVEATGAIIGRCCPDLDALCREDPPERLAQAHCKIKSEKDRFFVCDMSTSSEGTLLDGFTLNTDWCGPLTTGSLLTVGPLRIKIELSDMARDTPLKRPAEDADEVNWKAKVYRNSSDDKQLQLQRQQEYKDRASERRKRCGEEAGSGNQAIDGLINRFEEIRKLEEATLEAEDARVEMPMQEAQREANMGVDGTFIGWGMGHERAGIGFHAETSAELIPDVLDPKGLSRQDSSRVKTQMRFKQAHG
jgi:hypothetical protein